MSDAEGPQGPKIRVWTSPAIPVPKVELGSLAKSKIFSQRQAYEARIAELESAHANIDRLFRFQKQAYQARISELKKSQAETVAEVKALKTEVQRLRKNQRQLLTEARAIAKSLKKASP